jgi:excinuclease ABC subunit A
MKIHGAEWTADSPLPPLEEISQLDVVVDRLEMKEGIRERLAGSIEAALDLSQGIVKIQEGRDGKVRYLTEVYVCPESGLSFPPLAPSDFNFHSPRGACPVCFGLGRIMEIVPDLLFGNDDSSAAVQIEQILERLPKKTASPFRRLLIAFYEASQLPQDIRPSAIPASVLQQLLFGASAQLELTIEGEQPIKSGWQGVIPFLTRASQESHAKRTFRDAPFAGLPFLQRKAPQAGEPFLPRPRQEHQHALLAHCFRSHRRDKIVGLWRGGRAHRQRTPSPDSNPASLLTTSGAWLPGA